MRRYTIRNYKSGNTKRVLNLRELYAPYNGSYITGVCDDTEVIMDNSTVYVTDENGDTTQFEAHVRNVVRTGYVEYKTRLYEDRAIKLLNAINDSGNTTIKQEIRYVQNNGCFYYRYKNGEFDGYFIDGTYYPANDDGSILVTCRSYIVDGYVKIGNINFMVFNLADENGRKWGIKYDEYSVPLETINGEPINVVHYDIPEFVKEVALFTPQRQEIGINLLTCGTYRYFVRHGDNDYEVYPKNIFDEDDKYVETRYAINIDGVELYAVNLNDYESYIIDEEDLSNGVYIYSESDITDKNQITLSITSRLATSEDGDFVILITNEENAYETGDIIEFDNDESLMIDLDVITEDDERYVEYNNSRYYVTERMFDTITIESNDYNLYYTDSAKTEAYIYENDEEEYFKIIKIETETESETITTFVAQRSEPMFLKVESNGLTFTDYVQQSWEGITHYMQTTYGNGVTWDSGYTVNTCDGVIINGVAYPVVLSTEMNEEGEIVTVEGTDHIQYDGKTSARFIVSDVIGASTLLCNPIIEEFSFPSGMTEYVIESSGTVIDSGTNINYIISNQNQVDARTQCLNAVYAQNNMKCHLIMGGMRNALTGPENGIIDVLMRQEPTSSIDILGINNFKYEYAYDFIEIKLPLGTDVKPDALSDYVVQKDYAENVTKWNINRIVDMEKLPYRLYGINFTQNGSDGISGTYSAETQIQTFCINPDLNITFDINKKGSVTEGVKNSFFRLSFYDSMDKQSQYLIGTMCLMLGGDSISGYSGVGGLKFDTYKIDNNDVECFGVSMTGDSSSMEGLNLYAFKEMFDTSNPINIYMKMDFNNAMDGRVYPLCRYKNITDFKMINDALYFPFVMFYDNNAKEYVFGPDESIINKEIITVNNNSNNDNGGNQNNETDVIATFDVVDISTFTQIGSGDMQCFSAISVDGRPSSLTSSVTFTEKGEHIIKYTLKTESGETKICNRAFANCSRMSKLTILDNVTDIEEDAFLGCMNLQEIMCNKMTAPTAHPSAFRNVSKRGTLLIPKDSTEYDKWLSALGSGWVIKVDIEMDVWEHSDNIGLLNCYLPVISKQYNNVSEQNNNESN